MRALKEDRFLKDLESGTLAPLTEEVRSDHTLCLELRGSYINIYYRGGSLMKIEEKSDNVYFVTFDKNYFARENDIVDLPEGNIQKKDDIVKWLNVSPCLKRAMDHYFAIHDKSEREFQQLVVRENNFSRIVRSTDYYVCEIEYEIGQRKFDMIAAHWPSKPRVRQEASGRRLVFIEMKYGDDALEGSAGLCKHIKDINDFLNDPGALKCLKEDMVKVFNQKRKLKIMDCGKDLESFCDTPPICLLVLANHDPGKSKLRVVLDTLPECPKADLRIATASFFGYGLYDQGVHTVEEFRKRFPDYIHSGSVER